MFTAYFQEILHRQQLDDEDRNNINEVFSYLQHILQIHPAHPIVKKAGSQAKEIAVHAKFDLDMQVIFPKEDTRSLQQIYNEMLDYLTYYDELGIRQGDIAIQVIYNHFKTDVVPAKDIDGIYVNVWHSQSQIKQRTSIDKQIDLMANFGRRDVFKLIKLWKIANELKGPSFLYEIFTMRALEVLDTNVREYGDLGQIMWQVWDYIYRNALNIRLVDPTNVNNIVSDLWDQNERERIKKYALYVIQGFEDDEIDPIFWNKY